ncbi:hypothetical protein [Psychroflexus maritimus]|uniref:Secreted protein n=1 Tax=Psychroflexus maritimus TaxID=2714865 RepID=A0A967DY85_9FLAO|nr:hypothetical protein [Psychroflexus maritimus]NGZ89555.1 hypothetical protein [Psychroflexus maritimus]
MRFLIFVFCLFLCGFSFAQLDGSKRGSEKVELKTAKGKAFPETNFGIPNLNKKGLEKKEEEDPEFLKEKQFTNPSDLHEKRLNEKFKEDKREPKIREEFGENMDLGEFKTSSGKVVIACRDHMMFDGDRVQIKLNGEIIAENILLENKFKTIYVDLKEGFNKVEFIALNQGTAGPNTAELKIFDEDGKIIVSNVWNLLTGVNAHAMFIKE